MKTEGMNMKKILAALCFAAALTGCAGAEGKAAPSSSEKSVPETTSAAASKASEAATAVSATEAASEAATAAKSVSGGEEGWRSSYKAVIEERKASADHDKDDRFSLDDIDMDGVPELAIKTVKNNSYSVLLYSYSGGEAKLAEKFDGALYSWADGSYVMEAGYDADDASSWEDFYELRAGDLIKRATLTKAYDKNDVSVVETYAVDGDEVDENEYDAQRRTMASGVLKSLGESFDLSDGVVEAVFDENGDWKQAYRAFLLDKLENEAGEDNNAAFSILDVNGDGVPELFYTRGFYLGAGVEVYSYSGGLVGVGEYGSHAAMNYYPDTREMFVSDYLPNFETGAFYVMRNDLRFGKTLSYACSVSVYDEDAPEDSVEYLVNDAKVSGEEYAEASAYNSDKPFCPLGRDNPLTKENAEALLKGVYKAPEYEDLSQYSDYDESLEYTDAADEAGE